jgi:hypothetical protein
MNAMLAAHHHVLCQVVALHILLLDCPTAAELTLMKDLLCAGGHWIV